MGFIGRYTNFSMNSLFVEPSTLSKGWSPCGSIFDVYSLVKIDFGDNMIKVLFVCLGNICRSPMGEFILKDLVKKEGLETHFEIASSGTSSEELGNPIYYLAKEKLKEHGISCEGKRARKMNIEDGIYYDYILAMETENIRDIKRIIDSKYEDKIYRLMDFTNNKKDIEDPWYTRDFDTAYKEIEMGCKDFLKYIINKEKNKC